MEMRKAGQKVALVSDAGTPTISDPGYHLVQTCAEGGLSVVPIPGPVAAIVALSASGLPTDSFLFLGFPPHKQGKLERFVEEMLVPGRTSIIYLPLRRLPSVLKKIAGVEPEARVVVARELTKVHEEFIRGSAKDLLEDVDSITLKGECTLLAYVNRPARVKKNKYPR